jgi:hypothetical protein
VDPSSEAETPAHTGVARAQELSCAAPDAAPAESSEESAGADLIRIGSVSRPGDPIHRDGPECPPAQPDRPRAPGPALPGPTGVGPGGRTGRGRAGLGRHGKDRRSRVRSRSVLSASLRRERSPDCLAVNLSEDCLHFGDPPIGARPRRVSAPMPKTSYERTSGGQPGDPSRLDFPLSRRPKRR